MPLIIIRYQFFHKNMSQFYHHRCFCLLTAGSGFWTRRQWHPSWSCASIRSPPDDGTTHHQHGSQLPKHQNRLMHPKFSCHPPISLHSPQNKNYTEEIDCQWKAETKNGENKCSETLIWSATKSTMMEEIQDHTNTQK